MKVNRMKSPDKNSLRSRRRAVRGWRDLETSSRKHRRANKRQLNSRKIMGLLLKAGEKTGPTNTPQQFTAGGAFNYH